MRAPAALELLCGERSLLSRNGRHFFDVNPFNCDQYKKNMSNEKDCSIDATCFKIVSALPGSFVLFYFKMWDAFL